MAAKNKKLKILLIEDNGIFLNIVSELLVNHEVIGAKTAEEGLKKYKEYKPDLIFLDLSLPDGNGHDLLIKFGKDKNSYVVVMTASRLKEDILQSMQEGAQGYIIKPFSSDMLHECIKEYYDYKKNGSSAKNLIQQ